MDEFWDYWPMWALLALGVTVAVIGYLDTTVWAPAQQARIAACHAKGGILLYDSRLGRVCAITFERVP